MILNTINDPKHEKTKVTLRIVGISLLVVGAVLEIISLASFAGAFGSMSGPSPLFFLSFIGIPCLFVGGVCTALGFMRATASFVASQGAPVTKDTINYMVDGTSDTIAKTVNKIKNGLDDDKTSKIFCKNCGLANDSEANFCIGCGKSLKETCPHCGAIITGEQSYCDKCGAKLK